MFCSRVPIPNGETFPPPQNPKGKSAQSALNRVRAAPIIKPTLQHRFVFPLMLDSHNLPNASSIESSIVQSPFVTIPVRVLFAFAKPLLCNICPFSKERFHHSLWAYYRSWRLLKKKVEKVNKVNLIILHFFYII